MIPTICCAALTTEQFSRHGYLMFAGKKLSQNRDKIRIFTTFIYKYLDQFKHRRKIAQWKEEILMTPPVVYAAPMTKQFVRYGHLMFAGKKLSQNHKVSPLAEGMEKEKRVSARFLQGCTRKKKGNQKEKVQCFAQLLLSGQEKSRLCGPSIWYQERFLE